MDPFRKATIKQNPQDKGDHVNRVRQNATHTYFPSPWFSEINGVIPKKMRMRTHDLFSLAPKYLNKITSLTTYILLLTINYRGYPKPPPENRLWYPEKARN